MRRRLLVLLFVIAVATVPAAPLAAQSGTPATDAQGAASCADVEPRDAEFFRALSGTPAAATAEGANAQGAAATPTPFAMPEGEPADEAVLAEVTALYEQLIACLNAGEYLRAYALYSDEYLERNLSEEILDTLQATPVPAEESMQSEFGGVLEARLLEDGRVGALVSTSNPQSGEVLVFAILRRDDDRMRIDEEQVVEAEGLPATPAGTPAG
jgi:hypothetical protein